MRRRRRVRLAYRSYSGAPSERDLDPYGLVFHSGRWYVVGLDHRSSETRTFRVDRVVSAVTGEESFAEPAEFDPVGQVMAALSSVPYRHPVRVLLRTTLEEARRRIPPSVAALAASPDGDGVLMTTRAERLDGMAQMLAGLGWPLRVLEPDPLRDELRSLADRLREYADR